jgi:hypothetical protein
MLRAYDEGTARHGRRARIAVGQVDIGAKPRTPPPFGPTEGLIDTIHGQTVSALTVLIPALRNCGTSPPPAPPGVGPGGWFGGWGSGCWSMFSIPPEESRKAILYGHMAPAGEVTDQLTLYKPLSEIAKGVDCVLTVTDVGGATGAGSAAGGASWLDIEFRISSTIHAQ